MTEPLLGTWLCRCLVFLIALRSIGCIWTEREYTPAGYCFFCTFVKCGKFILQFCFMAGASLFLSQPVAFADPLL